MHKIYFADDPAGETLPRGTHAYKWRGKKAGVKNPLLGITSVILPLTEESQRVVKSPPAPIPVDPAGPDRYRGRAKPWELYTPGKGVWRTAE